MIHTTDEDDQRYAGAEWRKPDALEMIPEHMHEAIVIWIERGKLPGQFLEAVLRNDLHEAAGRADPENAERLAAWCVYLHNYAPSICYGRSEHVDAWRKRGGDAGHEAPP